MSTVVFVSYRRDDAGHQAGRLAQSLEAILGEGSVFFDSSSIGGGERWPETLRAKVEEAPVMVVVMGGNWLKTTDDWGYRRIDQEHDWVRQEIELALALDKRIVPVCVDGAVALRADKLPHSIDGLAARQHVDLRRDHWNHDVKLVVASLDVRDTAHDDHDVDWSPYPKPSNDLPDPLSPERIAAALAGSLPGWSWRTHKVELGITHVREELYRSYRFPTFQAAVEFMAEVAPGCDIAIHHPHWENIFRTVYVHLTTFDIGHRISDRDVQLAKYLDQAYRDFLSENASP